MNPDHIRSGLLIAALMFIGFLTLRNKQNTARNWAMFYAMLYTTSALPIVNVICVNLELWSFTDAYIPAILIPIDIFFLWIFAWGIIPIFFLQRKYFLIVLGAIFWLDFLIMPALETVGILELQSNWWIGEIALVLLVFTPGYIWAYSSFHKTRTWLRALLQVGVMIMVFVFGLPFLLSSYSLIDGLHFSMGSLLFQFFVIIALPALMAVVDLVQKGKGTPFPYDKTENLVITGVYAYIRNPIQWSFTLIFIPMAIYHSSWYLLIGSIISLAYSIAVADFHEYSDMEKRFENQWTTYISSVPKWYFLWRPYKIAKGTIYFDSGCNHCSRLAAWFSIKDLQQLTIKKANEYKEDTLKKVTYVDHLGTSYSGIAALANALEHINLMYATIGWFIRFPLIIYMLDSIVYSMVFGDSAEECEKIQH